ncbi:hypothetical protein IWW50_004427, partial [Coemansia erecta]
MKRQLGLLGALVVGTMASAQASEQRSNGMGLFEVDMDYNPAELFSAKQDGGRFDQPEAFSRDINNFVSSQGYKQPEYGNDKSVFGDNKPAFNGDMPSASNDKPAFNGDLPSASNDKPAFNGDLPSASNDKAALGAAAYPAKDSND